MHKAAFDIPWEGWQETIWIREMGKRREQKESQGDDKIKNTIIECKVNLSTVITEKVNGFNAFLLQPLLEKITQSAG